MKKLASSLLCLLPLVLTACNVFGGLSKPSDDNQYLVAARACLDQGDYPCAIQNYDALSSQYNDEKVSELSLTILAENNIFSISDLVASLGTSFGSSASFSFLAEALEQRQITAGSYRTTIKGVFDDDLAIEDTKLRAFSKFLASLAMFNEVLANAVGSDGTLSAGDIVENPTVCKPLCQAANPLAAGFTTDCGPPTGTALTYNPNDTSSMTTTGPGTGAGAWSGAATVQKFITSANEAANDFSNFSGGSSNQGFSTTLQALSALQTASHTDVGPLNAQAEATVRCGILTALSL